MNCASRVVGFLFQFGRKNDQGNIQYREENQFRNFISYGFSIIIIFFI